MVKAMDIKESIEALKYINLTRVHPFFSWEEMKEVRDIAIEALEKQVPKKPTKLEYKLLLDMGWIYRCPACGCACGENKYHPEVTQDDMYCTQCGQKLDWE